MPILQLLPLASEEGSEMMPFLVGGGILVFLFACMIATLAFGKGREHS